MLGFEELLGSISSPPKGRNRRISSNEQPNWNDGNFDMTPLAPGQVLELPVLQGPGIINHIWFTSHAGGVNELNALSLRIYWDGREEPGVEAPLGEFFAVGQGKPAVVESVPVQVSPTGSLTCYWRMPFAESARIVITNDNPNRTSGLYWQVDWMEIDALPPDTPYFHAQYRQEYPAVMGQDYLIADIEGSGRFVGTVMSVTLGQDGWFGEGDDFFYIDGEEVPSLQGTGTEDYFNDAWGFRARTGNWFGQPRWQGWDAGDSGICYRWHLPDPVGFKESLKVTIEHKGNRMRSEDGWFIERPDFFNSIAFWYQTGTSKRFGELPGWPERCVPWHNIHLVPSLPYLQPLHEDRIKVETSGFFGGRPSLIRSGIHFAEELSLPFTVPESGRYAIRLVAFSGPRGGKFDVEIDSSPAMATLDLQTPEEDEKDFLLGTFELDAGQHKLSFASSADAPPAGLTLAVEMLRLLKLPPEADRKVKNHNEAHFVRLGIGRALYAFRLAYGHLPDSLEKLAESGIMEPRFLNDENGAPLTSRLEGDYFVIEAGSAGWNHRLQGLDARR